MKRTSKFLALTAAPVALAGLLMSGASGFSAAAPAGVGLNQVSDRITFTATLIIGGTHFAINSSSCTVHEDTSSIPCRLNGAGEIVGATSTSHLTITGRDGTISFDQSAVRTGPVSCATGTGIELGDDSVGVVPIRIEASSIALPITSTMITVNGTITVYEQGGTIDIGAGCGT
jgi:hypothetical protein